METSENTMQTSTAKFNNVDAQHFNQEEAATPSSESNNQNNSSVSAGAPVTVITNDTGNLTKTFIIDSNGNIQKKAAAKLMRGSFSVQRVADLGELDVLLNELLPTQAVTFGQPDADNGIIGAQNILAGMPGAIARTRENFQFANGRGILMLDYDPPKEGIACSPEALIATLRNACPFLENIGMLWRPSSSSGVDGVGIRGQRIYLMVDDAREIPRIGKVIFDRLWLANSGYFITSKSGQLLERSCVDASVWKPEGLDFAARPVMAGDIVREHYDSVIHAGGILSAVHVLELTKQEKNTYKEIKAEERAAMHEQVVAVKTAYAEKMTPTITKNMEKLVLVVDAETAKVTIEAAIHQHVLMGNFPLTTPTGAMVSVGEVLDKPEKWHNTRFADPLEPDLDNRVAWLNLYSGGRPTLYSHLHGGIRYTLERAPELIIIEGGQLPEMVDALAKILRKHGGIYERGGSLVYVNDDARITPIKAPWFAVHAQRQCRFERYDKKQQANIPTSCPPEITHGILSHASQIRMPKLTAVRTAPTMDATGRSIDLPGYDTDSSLLLVNNTLEAWPSIPSRPSKNELIHALEIVWHPFESFPYAETMDASVALAAILTAAVRPCLRTAPGFGFSATAPGTGKTLLAQCIGALYDGVAPSVTAPITHEEEWAKSLFSAVLGGAGTLLFDNAEHPIESASLCAATTSPSIKGRILGESREAEAEHRLMIMATGNGLQLVGDLNRRFFVCRLDAKMESSQIVGREFAMEPLSYCTENRVKLVTAALTLIRGYVIAGLPRVCDGLASMDDWNKLVRSTIVWLIQQGIAPDFTDPKNALSRDAANDPDSTMLRRLFDAIKNTIGRGSSFTIATLVKRSMHDPDGLGAVLDEIAGERGTINARILGRWITARDGRILDQMRLIKDGKARSNVIQWKLCDG